MTKRAELIEKKFADSDGIPRVSLVPQSESDGNKGIPISLDLSALYKDAGADFQRRLYEALHAQGLIKPVDYFLPDAPQRFKAAMLTVIRYDFSNAQALALEEINHARGN